VNDENLWGAEERLVLEKDVRPGKSVVSSWTTTQFSEPGMQSTVWHMACGDEAFEGEAVAYAVMVLPTEPRDNLKAWLDELKKQAEEWLEGVQRLLAEWIERLVTETIATVCTPPAAILPVVLLIVITRRERRRKGQ
jgi:hypothetical protein